MNRQDYYEPNEDFLERMWKQPKNVLNLIVIAANILIFLLVSVTGGTDDMENMIRWGAAYTPADPSGRNVPFVYLHVSPFWNPALIQQYAAASVCGRLSGENCRKGYLLCGLFSGRPDRQRMFLQVMNSAAVSLLCRRELPALCLRSSARL